MSEWYTIFVLTFQASMGFSVVKVIMGVFLQNTFSVAANDDVKLGMRRLSDIDVMFEKEHPKMLWWIFVPSQDSCKGYWGKMRDILEASVFVVFFCSLKFF